METGENNLTKQNTSLDKLPKKEEMVFDWESIELMKSELKEIFESMERHINTAKGMSEIAVERNFVVTPEAQQKIKEIIKKFQPYGEYMPILYKMISDLGSISTLAYKEGLLVTAPELNKKLEEIKNREK